MAKPSWLKVSPTSGSGNGNISNTADEHTGRVARTGTVTVTGSGISTPKTYKVNQEPKSEFVSFNNGAEMAAPKGGGTLTVEGKSNSSKLSFSWVTDGNGVEIPANYQANGASTNNDAAIAGDPGATAEFPFSIALQIPENETIESVNRTLKVTANGAQYAQIVIKQAAGDPTLALSVEEITIPQAGTPAVSVAVTSNTSWTVS